MRTKTKAKPRKKTKTPRTRAPRPDPLALVKRAQPTIDSAAKRQTAVNETRTWFLDVVPIRGVGSDELAEILKRESVKSSYENWSDAKAVAMPLSDVGGIKSVTIVGRTTKVVDHRSEMWESNRCVSMNGGLSRISREKD